MFDTSDSQQSASLNQQSSPMFDSASTLNVWSTVLTDVWVLADVLVHWTNSLTDVW